MIVSTSDATCFHPRHREREKKKVNEKYRNGVTEVQHSRNLTVELQHIFAFHGFPFFNTHNILTSNILINSKLNFTT